MNFPLDEVVVGVTDYLLALECAFFAWALMTMRGGWRQMQHFFAAFFGVTALASITGGTSHVFFPESTSLPADVLWKATVVALGGAAFAAWSVGATLLFAQPTQRRIVLAAAIEFLIYGTYVVAIDDRFVLAIANYIPAAVFLAASFAVRYSRRREAPILSGLAGLAVTAIAAAVQRSGIAIHPLYFNHNATYHAVQGIGFLLLFIAALLVARVPAQVAKGE